MEDIDVTIRKTMEVSIRLWSDDTKIILDDIAVLCGWRLYQTKCS